MKKILYIAPWKQSDGWGQGSREYIESIKTTKYELAIRNIILSQQIEGNIDKSFLDLEKNKFDSYDFLIQKVLPELYTWDGRFKQNIGINVFETELTKHHIWINRINLLDKLFVTSLHEKKWLSKLVKTPIYNIGQSINIDKMQKKYPPLDFMSNDLFKFTFIGEDVPRKNLDLLIKAYLQEFSCNDNAILIIKTNKNISEKIHKIRQSIRKNTIGIKYPQIFLINNRLSENEILSLIQNSDILVAPSSGEAFHRPAAMSLCMGVPIMGTDNTAIIDYLTEDLGWIISSKREQVHCEEPPIQHLYTSEEYHYVPNVLEIRNIMRECYSNKKLYKEKRENIIKSDILEKFSYTTIGNNISKALED